MISERLWQRLFNGSPQVLGQSMRVTGWENTERVYTIVGVMPHEFQYPRARTDVWKTLAFARAMNEERVRELVAGGNEFIVRHQGRHHHRRGTQRRVARGRHGTETAFHDQPNRHVREGDAARRIDHAATIGPALWILMSAVDAGLARRLRERGEPDSRPAVVASARDLGQARAGRTAIAAARIPADGSRDRRRSWRGGWRRLSPLAPFDCCNGWRRHNCRGSTRSWSMCRSWCSQSPSRWSRWVSPPWFRHGWPRAPTRPR